MNKIFSRKSIVAISAVLLLACAMVALFPLKAAKQPARAKDTQFDAGSGIELAAVTDVQSENLYRLCKIWGFVKYRHPSVTSGDINWDAELFRVMPKVLNAGDSNTANAEILAWLSAFPFEAADPNLDSANILWINDAKALSEPLSEYLVKLSRVSVTDNENGYAAFQDGDFRVNMSAENTYPAMRSDDTGMKLLALFRYWNIVEYFYPYKDITGENWDDVLREMLPQFVVGSDRLAYVQAVSRLSTFIHDSHASVRDRYGDMQQYFGTKMPPVEFANIDGKIIISAAAAQTQLKTGDIVLSMDGKSIEERVASCKKYVSLSNDDRFAYLLRYSLFGTNNDTAQMEIVRGGEQLSLTVECLEEKSLLSGTEKSALIEDGQIGYINPALLKGGDLDKLMKKFKDAKGIIVDLRNYPSDFIAYTMAEYLNPQPVEFAKFACPNKAVPGDFLLSESVISGGGAKEKYQNKVVLLMDETSMSQSEFTIMSLRTAPNTVVLGSGSIGADGDVVTFTLPGSITARMTGLAVFYPDGTQTQRVGLSPDIECRPTISDLAAGKDTLLIKAAEIILG